ncbi:hypothetical protein [Oryzifoliimicrobium ureilyticus]|uniref:hypothetical protein n=1 Tax=Oryzifoliimicrobium ureilyticus TaxID=3113724 RepID=UPI00307648D6
MSSRYAATPHDRTVLMLSCLGLTCGYGIGKYLVQSPSLAQNLFALEAGEIGTIWTGLALTTFALLFDHVRPKVEARLEWLSKMAGHLRARARRRWKGDRSLDDYHKAEATVFVALAVPLFILVLAIQIVFIPLLVLVSLILYLSLIRQMMSLTNQSPLWSPAILMAVGLIGGYLLN